MRAAGRVVAAASVVAALAGCGGTVAVTQAAVTADVRTASCLDPDVLDALGLELDPSLSSEAPEPTTRGLPPADFVADSVVVCDRGETLRDSAGRWWAVTTTLLEGDLDPLVTRLDDVLTAECRPAVVPQVWLVDAMGDAVLLPRETACTAVVAQALDDLQAVDTTERPVALAQVGTDAAAS